MADVIDFFLKFLMILVSAKVLAELFAYLRFPSVLGELAAGIIIGPSLLSVKVETGMKPIIELFVPVFFVMVGVSVDLRAIEFTSAFWGLAGILTFAAIIAKIASGTWAKGPFRTKVLTGISMVPRGEVGLIFAEVGRRSGVFDNQIYAVVVFAVALTTLAAPLLLRVVVRKRSLNLQT